LRKKIKSKPDRSAGSPDEGVPVPRINMGIIIPSLEKYGGAERFVIECVKHWQNRHAITIYATVFDREMLKASGIGSSVNLVRLTPDFEGEHAFLTNTVLLPKIWRQEIGRHDVYHTHLWPTQLVDLHPMVWFPHEPLRMLHDLRFEQRLGSGDEGHVVHMYPKYNYDEVEADLYSAYLSAIDGMDQSVAPALTIANSRYTAGYLAEVYGRDMPHVVYPGVDMESPINLEIDQNLFVTISQLWPHKRTSLLIEAIALTDEIQLIVIGSGPDLDRLKSLTVKLGVENRVFFLAGLSHFEVRLVLARACAFLFCPIREPFGIVVLEAMAAGKPIVAVDEGGYVEVCHPDFAMLIPASPLIFAEKIQHLRDNPDQVRLMGEAARKAVQPFSWKRTATELERFLVDASAKGKSSGTSQQPSGNGSRPLFGIQYYLWYGEGFGAQHWNDNPRDGHVVDHPFLGFYPSEMGKTIEHHISQFEAMKLDYAILNLHVDENGMNEVELRSIQNLFEIAGRKKSALRFAIQISVFNSDADRIRSAVTMIAKLYADREEYLRVDGKPVLFWFWSSAYDGNRVLFETMHQTAARFRNLAVSLRMAKGIEESQYTFDFFEGFGLYSPLEISSEENWGRAWQSAYDAGATAGMSYRMVTVSPGYDDHALLDARRDGNPNRIVPRRDGEVYTRSLEFAASLSPPPHFIIVSTFNEYHENTHIELSAANRDLYVRMTRDFIETMHNLASRGAANE
jgi:glycosyltransferase involved in cell wall biosynthesis